MIELRKKGKVRRFLIQLWGETIKVEFSPHSIFRAKQRFVPPYEILRSIIACSKYVKNVPLNNKFAIIDRTKNITFIAARNNVYYIGIITVISSADIWTYGVNEVIVREKNRIYKERRNFYEKSICSL